MHYKRQTFLTISKKERARAGGGGRQERDVWRMLGEEESKAPERIQSVGRMLVLSIDRHQVGWGGRGIKPHIFPIDLEERMAIPGELTTSGRAVPLELVGVVSHDALGTHSYSYVKQ